METPYHNTAIKAILDKWHNRDWTEELNVDAASHCSASRLVTIGGCARSGTTLLRVMLDTHSDIYAGPPTNLFIPTPVVAETLAYSQNLPVDSVQNLLRSTADRAELIDRFQTLCLERSGKHVWVDKTARNVHRFGWTIYHFPQALIIHVIRDGRDAVCSLRTHRKRQVVNGELQPTGMRIPIQECADRWLRDVSAGLVFRRSPSYLEVRYEDLVTSTETTLRRVCRHLNVEYQPTMLRFHETRTPLRDPLRFPQNLEATQPLYTSAVGRWRRDLEQAELDIVLERIGPLLQELHYV